MLNVVVYKQCSAGTKGPEVFKDNFPQLYITTTSLVLQFEWTHTFMLFTPNSGPTGDLEN